jgi:Skp family chaperone for outer membrane proteins
MKRNHPQILKGASRSVMILALLLMSGMTRALAVPGDGLVAQSALSVQEQEKLDRLDRTATLFNVMLGVFAVLVAGAIAALYLLRRSVIREVTEIVQTHLRELGDLESQIASSKVEIKKLLQEYEEYAADLGDEADGFQKRLAEKQADLEALMAEFEQRKQQSADLLQGKLEAAQQRLGDLETGFSSQVAEIQRSVQGRQDEKLLALDEAAIAFTRQLSDLQGSAQQQKEQTWGSLGLWSRNYRLIWRNYDRMRSGR